MEPLVSIVIPVFNGADYLPDAIESALGQTYPKIEIIVVNDGSTDGGATEAIALSYGERIRYFLKPNGHVASALNFGIRHMQGEYFSWLSHDDLYISEKVAAQVEASHGIDGPAVLYCDYEIIDEHARQIGIEHLAYVEPLGFRYALTTSYPINGCGALVPRFLFERYGAFDEKLRTTQDYDLWFRFAEHVPFVHMPVVLIKSRYHANQGTQRMRDVVLRECDEILTRFVRALRPEDVVAGSGQPLWLGYQAMAASLAARSYSVAASAARELATKSRPKGVDRLVEMIPYVARHSVGRVRDVARGLRRRLKGRP